MIRCLNCSAETSNGLALCELCQQYARSCLQYLPIYFGNLARWRPGRAGSRPVPGSRVLYDGTLPNPGTGDRISDTLDETTNTLLTWARVLVDARPGLTRMLDRLAGARASEYLDDAQTTAWLCKGFERHLTSIATTDWCGEFVRGIGQAETTLRGLTETAVPGWYAGGCRRCTSPTYVVPGLTWVTCGGCGATTYARDHLEVILSEAVGWVAPPMRLAEAVVALLDTELSVPRLHKRISKWGESRTVKVKVDGETVEETRPPKIEPLRRMDADGDPVGPKRFRFGDVMTMLSTEGTTRLTDKRTDVVAKIS